MDNVLSLSNSNVEEEECCLPILDLFLKIQISELMDLLVSVGLEVLGSELDRLVLVDSNPKILTLFLHLFMVKLDRLILVDSNPRILTSFNNKLLVKLTSKLLNNHPLQFSFLKILMLFKPFKLNLFKIFNLFKPFNPNIFNLHLLLSQVNRMLLIILVLIKMSETTLDQMDLMEDYLEDLIMDLMEY